MLTVPLSFTSRPFDPVSFLAGRIEERSHISWEKDAIVRTRLARTQKDIVGGEQKRVNVFNTFKLSRPLKVDGQRILLLDDILSSGATMNEISNILRERDPKMICVMVMARICLAVGAGVSD
jgi:predicted amidophosphoribosyltransferase